MSMISGRCIFNFITCCMQAVEKLGVECVLTSQLAVGFVPVWIGSRRHHS